MKMNWMLLFVCQVLELLVSLCSVTGLRKLLCEAVFRSFKPRRQPAGKKAGQARVSEPCVALLQWATGPLHDPERCSLLALHLLTELFEVCLKLVEMHFLLACV